jgi:uncharacterized phage protein (TIGR02218 family)
MKSTQSLPVALRQHYATGGTSLARLWKVTRTDALIFGFTDHDADIRYQGITYRAASGFDASAIASNDDLSVDNLEVVGVLNDEGIQSEDLEAGRWDGAWVEFLQVDWADTSKGAEILRVGVTGTTQRRRGQYTAEIRGLLQFLQSNIGGIVVPSCDADLGDARCTVDLEGSPGFRVAGTVLAASSRRLFTVSNLGKPDGWFDGGEITFTSGANDAIRMEVKQHDAGSPGTLETQLPMPYDIAPGDTFTIVPGCDKSKATCIAKFNNVLNFRGFSFVPGPDEAFSIGGQ